MNRSSDSSALIAPAVSRNFWIRDFFAMEAFVHSSKRYRLFFDETGNGDLQAVKKDPNQGYLSLTGLAIRQDQHDGDITTQVNALKQGVFGRTDIILHRREIIDAKNDFAILNDAATRAKFDAEFLALVGKLPRPAFTVSIDKQEHLNRYERWQFNPYHYAMTCLLERFVLWLHYSGNVGDVMGEARGPKHDAQLRRAFRFFYKNGTAVRTDVIHARLISRELRLVPKERNVAALQIADLLAHPAHRAYKFEKPASHSRTTTAHQLPAYCWTRPITEVGLVGSRATEGSGCPKKTRGPIAPGDRKRSPFDRSRIATYIADSRV